MKYPPKSFVIPEWKKKKGAMVTRLLYRPISYVCSSIFAQFGVTANIVSYISLIIGIVGSLCFLIPSYIAQIIGAVIINIWLLFDCIDGNIARTIKKQPFGEFADAISSYVLVGLMGTCMGFAVYFNGGLLFPKECIWIVIIGAFASSSDTLMRLIHQKYKNTERKLADDGIIKIETDIGKKQSKISIIIDKIDQEFGIGGALPLAILIATIFKTLDIIILYCFVYYFLSFVMVTIMYIRKAIKQSNLDMNNK